MAAVTLRVDGSHQHHTAANKGQEMGWHSRPCPGRFPGGIALGGFTELETIGWEGASGIFWSTFVKGCCQFGEHGWGKSGGCAGPLSQDVCVVSAVLPGMGSHCLSAALPHEGKRNSAQLPRSL